MERKTITTPAALKAACRVETLEPFGISIIARQTREPFAIAPGLLESILRSEKLLLLRGFRELAREELLELALSYPRAELLHWDSGPVMEMKVTPDPKNYLFSNERVPFHWDGAFHKVPSYLVFNCLEAPEGDAGGETLFTNTESIWDAVGEVEHARWEKIRLTYRTAKLAHYGGAITVPLVQSHPRLRHPILRFAEAVETDLNPVRLELEGIPDAEKAAFLNGMVERIYSSAHCYRHQWRVGDLLIADNHALIHGRNAFRDSSPRHLRRIQIL